MNQEKLDVSHVCAPQTYLGAWHFFLVKPATLLVTCPSTQTGYCGNQSQRWPPTTLAFQYLCPCSFYIRGMPDYCLYDRSNGEGLCGRDTSSLLLSPCFGGSPSLEEASCQGTKTFNSPRNGSSLPTASPGLETSASSSRWTFPCCNTSKENDCDYWISYSQKLHEVINMHSCSQPQNTMVICCMAIGDCYTLWTGFISHPSSFHDIWLMWSWW